MSDGTFQSDDLLEVTGQPAAGRGPASETVASADDLHLIELLRSGDEAAFVSLIESYHTPMLRLATAFVE